MNKHRIFFATIPQNEQENEEFFKARASAIRGGLNRLSNLANGTW
jgi:hypothetical protein